MKKSTSDKNSIILVSYKQSMPPRVSDTLQHQSYPVQPAGGLKEAEQLLKKAPAILLVYCEDTALIDSLIKALNSLKNPGSFPLILLGTEIDGYEAELNKKFLTATTLNIPFNDADLLEAASYSSDSLKSATKPAPQLSTPSSPVVPESSKAKGPLGVKDGPNSIPDSLFQNFEELQLIGKNIGGLEYLNIDSKQFKNNPENFPSDKETLAKIAELFEHCADQEKSDLYRTSFIGRRMTQVLQMSEKFDEDVKSASFLYPSSFFPDHKALYKKEYLDENSTFTRNEIGKHIQESARLIEKDLNIPSTGKIVSTMSRLLTLSAKADDDEISMIASSLLISDLTNRVCFQSGAWDSRRAYYLLKKFKTNNPYNFHPKVVCCAIKFLSEAIISKPLACLLPYAVRNDPELIDKAYQTKHREVQISEAKVPLTSLAPGMRLSKPLFAYDGRLVLSEGLIFDEDLIYRIWQLSALRPLNSPVVIFVNP